MTRLLAAAAGFAGTVIGGFAIGVGLSRATGASWWTLVGIFGGLICGIAVIVGAVRGLVSSQS